MDFVLLDHAVNLNNWGMIITYKCPVLEQTTKIVLRLPITVPVSDIEYGGGENSLSSEEAHFFV